MKVLLDLCHPAHVHFFKNPYQRLKALGVEVLVTSRQKECTQSLLDDLNIPHMPLYSRQQSSFWALGKELLLRNKALYQVARSWQPDLMAGIGGIFIAQVSKMTGIPSMVFYDGDNALLQNILTYPFASTVVVPNCYQGWTPHNTIRYQGLHELSYMHPHYFEPNYGLAIRAGLNPNKPNYLIRLVAWQASHDLGHSGFNHQALTHLIETLASTGHVIISSESPLPDSLKDYAYRGPVNLLHHLMAYCDGFVGESPTMAIEAAICGVPGLFVSSLQCGNILSMAQDYHLIRQVNLKQNQSLNEALDWLLALSASDKSQRLHHLLETTIDVCEMVSTLIYQSLQKEKRA